MVVDACRTPFGRFGGALKDIPAPRLGAHVIQALLKRTGMAKEEIQYVVMGTALMAGAGYAPARQAAIFAGLADTTDFLSLNNACASAARAVNLACMLIQTKQCDTVMAGGMENMSRAPYLQLDTRWGMKMGSGKIVDGLLHDGLIDAFYGVPMGTMTGWVAKEYGIGRKEMDAFALRSHQRACQAWQEGKFSREVVPVKVKEKRGEKVFEKDESLRPDTSLEKLAQLKPAFEPDGDITAGNAPGLNDGAAALLLMAESKAKALGFEPLARIKGCGSAAMDAKYIAVVPAQAIRKVCEKTGLEISDFKLVEINEAFAAVPLISSKILELKAIEERLNVNGGAVAIGHPVAASGARILMTLIYELRRRGGGLGVASICGAGCSGDAVVVEV